MVLRGMLWLRGSFFLVLGVVVGAGVGVGVGVDVGVGVGGGGGGGRACMKRRRLGTSSEL